MATLKFYKSANLPSSAEEGSIGFDTSNKNIKLKTSSGWENYSPVSGSVATLVDGKIPQSMLPSYVDDVLEYNGISNFPSTGESGKIYVDTKTNLTYRWSGSSYVEISPSIAIGTTSGTAFDGASGATLSSNLSTHTNNSTIHITSAERTKWNNAASTIPTVNNSTITISQTGKSNQTFTLNQSGNTTISLNDTNTDTKCTSVGNHYTPSGGSEKANPTDGQNLIGLESGVTVVTGITADAAGHITSVSAKGLYGVLPEYLTRTLETSTGNSSIALALGKTTEVTLSQATTFTLPSAPTKDSSKLREVILKMKVGSSVYTTTWPSGLAWAGGEVPTLEANTYYEFNFSYNIDCWCVAYQSFTV